VRNMSLREELHNARLVQYDPKTDLTLTWFGGHGIHAYDASGREVAFWNTGDFSQDSATENEILEDMRESIATGEYLTFIDLAVYPRYQKYLSR
jgi:hypothetical protein